jgi:hypothetical protein
MIDLLFSDSGIATQEKGIIHDAIGVREFSNLAMFDIQVRGMAEQIAAEEISGFDEVVA